MKMTKDKIWLQKINAESKAKLAAIRAESRIPEKSPGPIETPEPASWVPYRTAAIAIADLVCEKQKAYGDSFGQAGQIMSILYPQGIKIDQLGDALTIVRIIDKLFRIATKKDAFGESPWKDIMGYALLAVVKDGRNHPLNAKS